MTPSFYTGERRPSSAASHLFSLVPAAVAVNFVIGRLVAELGLPVYLDTVGTMLATVLGGVMTGVVAGLVSQLLAGLLSGYQWLAFAPIQLLIVLVTWWAVRAAGFRSGVRALGWGLLAGVLGGTMSAVISATLFGGVTATGVTAIVAVLRHAGVALDRAVLIASLTTDLLDKAVSFLLLALLLRALPRRTRFRFPSAIRAIGESLGP